MDRLSDSLAEVRDLQRDSCLSRTIKVAADFPKNAAIAVVPFRQLCADAGLDESTVVLTGFCLPNAITAI